MITIKRFANILGAAALVTSVLAQNVFIAVPEANSTVIAGSTIAVEVAKPRSLTGSTDVAVVIGVFPCASVCPDVAEILGDILYNGPYAPQTYPDSYYPYQNMTVTIPSWYSGLVQLGVAHFFLLGAGQSAQLQLTNITLNVVGSY